MLLCAAWQRLALAGGVADEGHTLLGRLPLDLTFRVCEEAQAASALVGRTELRMRTAAAAALPDLEPVAGSPAGRSGRRSTTRSWVLMPILQKE